METKEREIPSEWAAVAQVTEMQDLAAGDYLAELHRRGKVRDENRRAFENGMMAADKIVLDALVLLLADAICASKDLCGLEADELRIKIGGLFREFGPEGTAMLASQRSNLAIMARKAAAADPGQFEREGEQILNNFIDLAVAEVERRRVKK